MRRWRPSTCSSATGGPLTRRHRVAFVAQKGPRQIRSSTFGDSNQLQATPLGGTDDALSPFFSPDGRWIGFFADRKLKKIAVSGGAVVTLSDAPNPRGGAWGEDGTIVFSPDQMPGTRLLRVSSAGGKAEPLTSLAEDEAIQLAAPSPAGRQGGALYGQHRRRRLQRRESRGASHCRAARGRSYSAAAITAAICRAAIWSTSTTGRCLRRPSISTGWR